MSLLFPILLLDCGVQREKIVKDDTWSDCGKQGVAGTVMYSDSYGQ